MENRQKGILGMILAVVIWGVSFINIKIAMGVVGPMTLGGLRMTLATLVLLPILILFKSDLKIKRADLPLFMASSLIGITAYFYFENAGIKYISASIASIIIGAIPIFSVMMECIIYKKPLTKLMMGSLICSVAGVALIVGIDLKSLQSGGTLMGYALMVGAVLAWIVYGIASKPLFDKYAQTTIVFWQSLIGGAAFWPFIPFEHNLWAKMDWTIWMHIVILAVFASAIGFYAYLKGLDYLGIGESSVYINLIPVVTVVASFFWLGERLSLIQMIGGVLVLASVYLITLNAPKEFVEDALRHRD